MKFKFANKLTAIIAALVMLSGCKKYLDQQPITSVGPDQVFKDVPTTLQALAGVYSRLTGDNGYGLRQSLYYNNDDDNLMGPSGTGDDRRQMAHYSLTSLNSELPGPFSQLFEGIMLANICIDQIPKMDMYTSGSDQQKKQLQRMYGEALTLRAQFYFDAIKYWGDVPSHFLPSYVEANENPYPTRTNRDVIYDRILDDLKQAAILIPWRNDVTSIGDPVDERITKGTVKALRARIALFRGGYALRQDGTITRPSNYLDFYKIARDETNDIIASGQHSLYPDYKALWRDVVGGHLVGDPNGELMFQATAIGGGGTADSKLGYGNGPRVSNGSAFQGNSFVNPLPSYFYLFDSTDARRDVTIAPYYVNVDLSKTGQASTNMTDGKYRRDWIKNPVIPTTSAVQYFGTKWQLIRYSDVLLMFAEAENEITGPLSTTGSITPLEALNKVRRRSITPAPGVTVDITSAMAPDKATFFKYLVRERALELGAEGIRKWDLIRWNLLGKGLKEANDNMTLLGNRSTTLMSYSYMANPPDYVIPANLPTNMYYRTAAPTPTGDNYTIWVNNYYKPASGSAPSGQASVQWISSSILTTIVNPSTPRYGFINFKSGKHELMPIPQGARDANPNLTQNPQY